MLMFVFVLTQWQLLNHSLRFTIIESNHISLYVGKSPPSQSDQSLICSFQYLSLDLLLVYCSARMLKLENQV